MVTYNMWDSSYRPEQMFAYNHIADLHPDWIMEAEYSITGLSVDGKPYIKSCTPDIAIISKKTVIRVNGMYHYTSDLQMTKDEYQKEALEQGGWTVIDFDCRKMEHLFSRKWIKKGEEMIKLAQEEVVKYLGTV